jgi:predicted RNA-binding protein with TRAM domain
VLLSWTAPSNNGGSTVTGYNVYQGTSAGGEDYSTAVNGGTLITTTTYTVTALTNATTYYFTVKAVNAVGPSVASSEVWAIPAAAVPGAPTGVTATPANASAMVTWAAPSSSGGSAISSYKVTGTDLTTPAKGGQTCTWAEGALSCAVTGLTNGDAYSFTVTATNSLGTGAASSASSSVIPAVTVPGAPTNLVATPASTTVVLSWTAPANGGSAITGYNIYEGTSSGGESTTPVNGSTLITTTTYTVTALTNATTYYFTVKAVNAVGPSVASSEVWAIPAAAVPGAPTGVTATPANASATVSWSAPSNLGGSAITSYKVTATDSTTPAKGGQHCTWTSGALSCLVTGLNNGDSYTFTVTATNSVGTGIASSASSSIEPAFTVPSAPTGVIATPGNTKVVLSWTAPANGGPSITGYDVYMGTTPGGESDAPVNGTVLITATTTTVSGLTNATTYYFTVKAENDIGRSAASAEVWAIPAATVPGAPIAVTATLGSNGTALISWTAPLSSGGSAITGYVVTPYIGSTAQATQSFNSTVTTETVTGLTPGTAYSFTVAAVNASGTGSPSANSNVATLATATSTTSLKLSAMKVTYGHEQVEVLSVTVLPQYAGTTPTGTVTITGANCHVTLSAGKGSCTLSPRTFNAGDRAMVATYNGSSNFKHSASAKEFLTVATATTTTTLKLSAKSVTYGHEQRERLFVTVSPQYPGATPTGRVAISGANCLITLSSGRGSCTLSATHFKTGNRAMVATYNGNSNFKHSASAKEIVTIS